MSSWFSWKLIADFNRINSLWNVQTWLKKILEEKINNGNWSMASYNDIWQFQSTYNKQRKKMMLYSCSCKVFGSGCTTTPKVLQSIERNNSTSLITEIHQDSLVISNRNMFDFFFSKSGGKDPICQQTTLSRASTAVRTGLALWTLYGTEPRLIFQGYGYIFWFRALSATMEWNSFGF